MKTLTTLLASTGLALSLGSAAFAQENATVAFLMPDQASTRYEQHDYPGFKAEMEKLCASCTVIYQNANADVALQQQQFNSVIAQGAKVIVLDPVDSAAAAALVEIAQSQDVKVIAYDRPIPDKPADYYVSFDNQGIGKAIAEAQHRTDDGGRLVIAVHRLDEALVDLDLGEREGPQVGERGVAGAEIVHGDTDAQRPDLAQRGDRSGHIAGQRSLGDFHFEARGRKPERGSELALRIVAVRLIADELNDLLDARVEARFLGSGQQEIQAALDGFLLRVVLEDPAEDFEYLGRPFKSLSSEATSNWTV